MLMKVINKTIGIDNNIKEIQLRVECSFKN